MGKTEELQTNWCDCAQNPANRLRTGDRESNLNILRDLGNIALIVYIFLGCRASFSQVRVTDAFLQNPASPLLSVDVPLTTALSNIGYSLKSDGYILFGTTVVLNEMGEEPRVTLNLLPGDTVQRAIDSLSQQLPEYRWVLVYDHLMNVFPAQQTRCDLLDTRFDQLDIKNQNPANILGAPEYSIPELHQAIMSELAASAPGGGIGYGFSIGLSEGPRMNLSFRSVTVREILNRVVEKMCKNFPADYPPTGWVYVIKQHPASPGARRHSWNQHRSVPELNWKMVVARKLQ